MHAGDTITVRGEGGAVFDVDVPPDGSVQRELLDDALAKGRLIVVSAPEAEPKAKRGRKAKAAEEPEAEPVVEDDAEGEG